MEKCGRVGEATDDSMAYALSTLGTYGYKHILGICSTYCFSTAKTVARTHLNRLTPNDPYMGRTAPLTSKRCILYIYSTNVDTEYFKHALYSPFFLFKMQFVS